MTDAPLKLYWWQGVPNFGDALSPLVVAHVSGRQVQHAGPKGAELWAIGSLLHVARQNREAFRRRPTIWGTGQLGHVPRDVTEHVDIALLRGPVGASLLGVEATRFADPGLLADEVCGPAPEREDKIGLVPHHTTLDDPLLQAVLQEEPRLSLIDVRDECASVCRQIASCAHIIASSLHGLIVADAYGVPNTWLHPGAQAHFKYYDYAASVQRSLPQPLALEDVPGAVAGLPQNTPPYADRIAAAKEILHQTFPAHLRAETTHAVA